MDWQSATAQLGAVGLLIIAVLWYIRTEKAERKLDRETAQKLLDSQREEFQKQLTAERAINEKNFERVYALAQTSERTASELTAAVKGLHP